MFLDPKLEFIKTTYKDMNWHLYVDRSLSMSYHSQPSVGALISEIDAIIERIEDKNIPLKIFGFGTVLDTNWIFGNKKIQEGSTNLGEVLDHIRLNENNALAGSIIVTDGQINLGQDIPTHDLKISSPIHIIGVGNKTPMVDVAINSIDTSPYIIKGEDTDLDVTISSYGKINQRVNLTIYSDNKLVGSKVVNVLGGGSLEKVRFRINPQQSGSVNYKVQVSTLSDEINIQNNKQVVPIQVLKNEYAVAIITGAPNFNTRILKNILAKHPEYKIDHFVLNNSGYRKSLKQFWDRKYDLIIFDNNPVNANEKEWNSYLKIFAKKLISHQSSLAFFPGDDIHESTTKSFLSLMDLNFNDPLMDIGLFYDWNISSQWNTYFPFNPINHSDFDINKFPPLKITFELDSANVATLAYYSISEVNIPLLVLGEKTPIRFMVWASSNLNNIYYKTINTELSELVQLLINPVFSWLMRTGNGQDFYFRSDKNSYQQGEQVTITGKHIQDSKIMAEGFIHIYSDGSKINSKPIKYDKNTGLYNGQFWASQSGELEYDVEFTQDNQQVTVSKGSIQVQESQLELNHVYLNKNLLKRIADLSDGTFRTWDDRNSIITQINNETKIENAYSRVKLNFNRFMILFLIVILTSEWLLRRKMGFM
ncbi:MAG: hypothetical protein CMG57_01285 [Candidatus Marinimicrobia bacterium]|nr:hypothetical protein [Candidatus Neomarinimicrobiota bacterium]